MAGWCGAKTPTVEPGSRSEDRQMASFSDKLRKESLGRGLFYTLSGVKLLTARRRQTYNRNQPQNSLAQRPPAPEPILQAWWSPVTATLRQQLP